MINSSPVPEGLPFMITTKYTPKPHSEYSGPMESHVVSSDTVCRIVFDRASNIVKLSCADSIAGMIRSMAYPGTLM